MILALLLLSIFTTSIWATPASADLAFFVAPYVRLTSGPSALPTRGCAMRQFTPQIHADGGAWRAIEVLGNRCLAKVRASASTLSTINAAPGFVRVPLTRLDDPLSSLSPAQRTAIRNILTDAGYTMAEINARFPNLADHTLGDALRFLASRRLKPRYDAATDTIILDGPPSPTSDLGRLDQEVRE